MQSGTPLFALQELGGWASTEMVRRYAHLAADHHLFADRLCALRAVVVDDVGTKSHSPQIEKGLHRCPMLRALARALRCPARNQT